MNRREEGFLLLTGHLGNPDRKPLTVAQFRTLAKRVQAMERPKENREMTVEDLKAIGYGTSFAEHILRLLSENVLLSRYLDKGARLCCTPVTRVSKAYPVSVRGKLGLDSPGCFWARGDLGMLSTPMIALVGSREMKDANRQFAREVGRQAAFQGYTLVSGNARGADREAQESCLAAGGKVISVMADELYKQPPRENMLYLSEDGFEEPFSAQRALSRNRVIHSLGSKTFVAQSDFQRGGTWDGTSRNLNHGWSDVYCFADGSKALDTLCALGAVPVIMGDLADISALGSHIKNLFEE